MIEFLQPVWEAVKFWLNYQFQLTFQIKLHTTPHPEGTVDKNECRLNVYCLHNKQISRVCWLVYIPLILKWWLCRTSTKNTPKHLKHEFKVNKCLYKKKLIQISLLKTQDNINWSTINKNNTSFLTRLFFIFIWLNLLIVVERLKWNRFDQRYEKIEIC